MPNALDEPAPRLEGIPLKLTAPLALSYVALAPLGRPVMLTPARPGGSPTVYATPAAVDGPLLVNVTVEFTVDPAVAVAGALIDVDTSATAETAVVDDALSGDAFAPWLVVVPIVPDTVTDPLGGDVKLTPTAIDDPPPRLVGMPMKVTAPVDGSYDADAPPGRPLNVTPARPGGRPIVTVTPAAVDGPVLVNVTVPLTAVPAGALGGTLTVAVTSATAEIAVVDDALSGCAFAPWLVDVPIVLDTVTDPLAGAV